MSGFNLKVNEVVKRSELHDQYGGNRQSGISASAKTPNIFLFTHPEQGEVHGYYDRWEDNGSTLYYCGEGQNGDQEMIRGNKAILEHKVQGKALRIFVSDTAPGYVRYIGEFQLDDEKPYSIKETHSTNNGPKRRTFEFHLKKK
ncbi:MAG: restriction endonuclease [Neisseria sp.]|nr:restriction endonuclease [Neisseria sp.]